MKLHPRIELCCTVPTLPSHQPYEVFHGPHITMKNTENNEIPVQAIQMRDHLVLLKLPNAHSQSRLEDEPPPLLYRADNLGLRCHLALGFRVR